MAQQGRTWAQRARGGEAAAPTQSAPATGRALPRVTPTDSASGSTDRGDGDSNRRTGAGPTMSMPSTARSQTEPPSQPASAMRREFNERDNVTVIGNEPTDSALLRPLRSGKEPASKCKKIAVKANHFPVTFRDSFPQTLFHYDVVIAPRTAAVREDEENAGAEMVTTVPDRLLHTIWKEFQDRFCEVLGTENMPFDGKKNCYTVRELNFGGHAAWSGDLTMTDPDDDERERTFHIQLKFASKVETLPLFEYLRQSCNTQLRIDLPQDVIQGLDIGLRYSPSIYYTPCNRSFYSNISSHRISDLLQLCFGHNQSLVLGRDKNATLNVDMANKAFIRELTMTKLMELLLKRNPAELAVNNWDYKDFTQVNKFLKGKLLQYSTGDLLNGNGDRQIKHQFPCVEVVQNKDATYEFELKGKSITIQEYFRRMRNIRLNHPDWPVVHVGNKNMTNYVPLELLKIISQPYKGKLNVRDTTEMIKGAAKPPTERFERILRSLDNCKFRDCKVLQDFGMKVEPRMVEIRDAKLLPLPFLKFRDFKGREIEEKPIGPDGKFMIQKVLKPAMVPKIGVLNVLGNSIDQNTIKAFLEKLGGMAEKLGLASLETRSVKQAFTNARIYNARVGRDGGAQIRERLQQIKKDTNKGLAIVIVGSEGDEHSTIKIQAETENGVGILTQCVKLSTLKKAINGNQVLINLVLKLNVKLNGVNFKLGKEIEDEFNLIKEPIMFLGADVTHPSQDSNKPSIAAITASTGNSNFPGMYYHMHVQLQPSSEGALEVIEKPSGIILDMLEKYRKNNRGVPPKRIVMFRDGVSEGQFDEVKMQEFILGLKRACELLSTKYNKLYDPKLTFLVVKKRHHTRFMPVDKRDAVKPKDNIPPGTVVDTVITHPTEMEFFLNSHVGIQGTSKPTRYHVIHDDNDFTMEQLEKLTYYLCYTFVRCTQPVSYPAPTYYAHLAAYRARALIDNDDSENDLNILRSRMRIHPDLKENYPMFFV